MNYQVYKQPGVLPPFWRHSVIFFANLESLFFGNEEKLQELQSEVSGVNTYGGRLFPIINILFKNDNNLLLLEKRPCKSLASYFHDDLGLSLPEIELFTPLIFNSVRNDNRNNTSGSAIKSFVERISCYSTEYVDGFVSDIALEKWARKLERKSLINAGICETCNNKLELYNHLVEKNLPVMDTIITDSSKDIVNSLHSLEKSGYREVVVKSPIGASGIGMMKLRVDQKETEVPEYMFTEGPCLVQGWLEPGIKGVVEIKSPSVQLFVNEDSVYLYDITEQVLTKESIHQGNISPPPYIDSMTGLRDELMNQASEAGKWLLEQNYKGTASVDFLVVRKKSSIEVYICEINARITGATYPSVLARYFTPPGSTWIMRNFKTADRAQGDELISMFKNSGGLFLPNKESGFIPINFNFDESGNVHKGQFLFLGGDLKSCLNTVESFKEAHPVEWRYDRD